MFTFLVDLIGYARSDAPPDPRGGRVINLDTSLNFNNLHVQYEGGKHNMAMIAPDGQPTGFIWPLPYAEDDLGDAALVDAVSRLRDYATQNKSGPTALFPYQSLDFGGTSG